MAIDLHILALSAAFTICGLWAAHRFSQKSCMMVAPVLVLMNLVLWKEAYLAIPLAVLTLVIARRFSVNESWRNFLRVSGVLGGSLAILHMFGHQIM